MTDNNYTIFKIHLRALSPISITKRNFDILSETYTYIPAWTMWSAFVKLYALKENNLDYKGTQEKLKSIRLTNFYIAEENGEPLTEIKEMDRRKYISADLKNAINTLTNTSLEGALYEREYLYVNHFVGWVRINKDDNECEKFFLAIKNTVLFLGADKNTGFGKVKIIEVKEGIEPAGDLKEYLKNPQNNQYLLPVEKKEKEFFPLTLREWNNDKGSGMKISLK